MPLLLGMKVLIQIEELRRLDELLRVLGRLERKEMERRRVMVLRVKLIPLIEAEVPPGGTCPVP